MQACPMLVENRNGTLLTNLFLNTTGRVDITSSRPEQVSMGGRSGGVFTQSLIQVFYANANRKLDWDEVFPMIREATSLSSEPGRAAAKQPHRHDGVEQKTQTPYSFRTMFGREVNGLRLGIYHDNLVISTVDAGSPASRAGLRRGMRVVSVNGKRVDSDSQLITAVNFSARNAVIEVTSRGGSRRIKVQLAY